MPLTLSKRFLIFIVVLAILPFQLFSQTLTSDTKTPKVGLVLSGGGARGFAHIGVLKVLEEEGFEIDYIGGTSMGSVVGGFYAMGYSIGEIERIALETNWDHLFTDHIERKNLSFYEKQNEDVHIFSLAIKNKKVSIPPGLVYGQNAITMLTKLTNPAYQTRDFKYLNKPFLCMATDLLSGKAIKIDSGSLPKAIRASMSVPTAFVPLKQDPYYLVDGGLINNLPAKEVREMGADILIGVDVQTPLYKEDEIENLVDVMSQAIFLNAEETFNNNLDEIDLVIKPKINPYTSVDFDMVDSLIYRGEMKAREMLPQIIALYDSLGILRKKDKRDYNYFPEIDMVYVDKVEVKGNKKMSKDDLINKLRVFPGEQISIIELNKKIDQLYGSKLFHTINYNLNYSKDGKTVILLEVEEASAYEINLGVNYNDFAKAGLLLNLTGRNVGAPQGRLSLDIALGKAGRYSAEYVLDNGIKPGYGVDLVWINQLAFQYNEFGKKVRSKDIRTIQHHSFALFTLKNALRLKVGYELESTKSSTKISLENIDDLDSYNASGFAELYLDTYDRKYFPKSGTFLQAMFAVGTGTQKKELGVEESSILLDENSFFYTLDADASVVIPLSEHFVLQPRAYYRKNFGNYIPLSKQSRYGGFTQSYFLGYRPFPGFEFMELVGHTSFMPELEIRHQIFEDHYLSFVARGLSLDITLFDGLKDNDFYYGWNFKYSYMTIVGPISIGLAKAYPRNKLIVDFSLGYRF